jgi:hypothetical protein
VGISKFDVQFWNRRSSNSSVRFHWSPCWQRKRLPWSVAWRPHDKRTAYCSLAEWKCCARFIPKDSVGVEDVELENGADLTLQDIWQPSSCHRSVLHDTDPQRHLHKRNPLHLYISLQRMHLKRRNNVQSDRYQRHVGLCLQHEVTDNED